PSNANRAPWWPGRAFWPLTPLPDVLPLPEPRPRPSRFLSRVAPGFGWRLCSEIVDMGEIPRRLGESGAETSFGQLPRWGVGRGGGSVSRLDGDEVCDLADHPADRLGVLEDDRAMRTAQPQALERLVLRLRAADTALHLRDFELDRHGVLRAFAGAGRSR